MPLVLRSQPLPGESLEGFVARLAELNLHPGPQWILRTAKLTDGFDRRTSELSGLAGVAGVPVESLGAMSHWPVPGRPSQLRFGEHCVQMNALALYQDRICPLCIAQHGFARQLWHLKAYAVCHEHSLPLVDHCSTCGWQLRWQRPGLDRCRCGAQLQAGNDFAPESAVNVARQLSEVAASAPGPKLENLGVLTKVIWFFGTDHSDDDWRPRFMAKPTVATAAATAARAAPFVFDWDATFASWLQRFLPPPTRAVKSWIAEAPILLRLKTAFRQPESDYILDLVKAHLASAWDDGLRRRSEFCAAPREGNFITATKAAQMLRMNAPAVKRLVANGTLEGSSQRRGSRVFCLVSQASVQAHLADKTWLSPNEAAEYLGIPRKRLAKMRTAWGLRTEKRGQGNYYSADYLQSWTAKLAPQERKLSSDYTPWAELRFHNRALELVIGGRLRAFRDPSLGTGLRALLFLPAELRHVAHALQSESEVGEFVTARATVERLAVNHLTLKELVAQGLLVGRFSKGRLGHIELVSLRNFEKSHASAAAYARDHDLELRDLLYRLNCSGKRPLLPANAAARHIAVWRRKTLEGLDLSSKLPPPPQLGRR